MTAAMPPADVLHELHVEANWRDEPVDPFWGLPDFTPTSPRARAVSVSADFAMWRARCHPKRNTHPQQRPTPPPPTPPIAAAPVRATPPVRPAPRPASAAVPAYLIRRRQYTAAMLAYLADHGPTTTPDLHRATGVPHSSCADILKQLVSDGQIVAFDTVVVAHCRMIVWRYALTGHTPPEIVHEPTPRERIIAYLAQHGPATKRDICAATGLDRERVRYQVERLPGADFIVVGVRHDNSGPGSKLYAFTGASEDR